MAEESNFDIYLTLGLIVKGTPDSLKKLIDYAESEPNLKLIFTKTSGDNLRIEESPKNR